MKIMRLPSLAVLAIFGTVLLSSCAKLSYEHPMPGQSRNLKEIPEEFRGFYAQIEDEKSTLEVTEKQFMTAETTASLGDDFVLRPFQKYLVVNLRDEDGWVVYLAEKTESGNIRLYHTNIAEDEIAQKLGNITKIETFYDENGELEKIKINPTDQEFKLMVESDLFEAAEDFVPRAKP